jgi:hypothetical protein
MIKKKQKQTVTHPKRQTAPAPAAKSRALTKLPDKTVSTQVIDFRADAHKGMEAMGSADFAIPRIQVLQDLSPQVQKRDAKYIEGAEAGDICDVVGQVLYSGDEGIHVVAVAGRISYVEWVPRTKGGGFVADRTPMRNNPDSERAWQEFKAKCIFGPKGEITTPAGNEIRKSGEYFIFNLDKERGDYQPFVLNMGGTQFKKYRQWNTLMNNLKIDFNGEQLNPAMWYQIYHLTTTPERNDQGSWFGWKIMSDVPLVSIPNGKQIYLDAKAFNHSVEAGRVSAATPPSEDLGPSRESEDAPM